MIRIYHTSETCQKRKFPLQLFSWQFIYLHGLAEQLALTAIAEMNGEAWAEATDQIVADAPRPECLTSTKVPVLVYNRPATAFLWTPIVHEEARKSTPQPIKGLVVLNKDQVGYEHAQRHFKARSAAC